MYSRRVKHPSQHLEVSLFLNQDLDPSPLVVFLEAHSVLRGVVCWLQVSVLAAEPHLRVSVLLLLLVALDHLNLLLHPHQLVGLRLVVHHHSVPVLHLEVHQHLVALLRPQALVPLHLKGFLVVGNPVDLDSLQVARHLAPWHLNPTFQRLDP